MDGLASAGRAGTSPSSRNSVVLRVARPRRGHRRRGDLFEEPLRVLVVACDDEIGIVARAAQTLISSWHGAAARLAAAGCARRRTARRRGRSAAALADRPALAGHGGAHGRAASCITSPDGTLPARRAPHRQAPTPLHQALMLPPSASPRKAAARPAAAPPSIATASPSARPGARGAPAERIGAASVVARPPPPRRLGAAGAAVAARRHRLARRRRRGGSRRRRHPTTRTRRRPTRGSRRRGCRARRPAAPAAPMITCGARSVSAVSDEVEEDIDEALYDELAMIAPSRGSSRQYGYASAPYGSPGYSPPLMDSGEPSMDPSMDNPRVDTPAEPLPPAERAARAAGVDDAATRRRARRRGRRALDAHGAGVALRAELAGAFPPPSAAPTPAARLALMTDTLAAATVGEPKAAAPAAAEKTAAAPLGEAERTARHHPLAGARRRGGVQGRRPARGVLAQPRRPPAPRGPRADRVARAAVGRRRLLLWYLRRPPGRRSGGGGGRSAPPLRAAEDCAVRRRAAAAAARRARVGFGGFNTALHATAPHASSGGGRRVVAAVVGRRCPILALRSSTRTSRSSRRRRGSPHSPFYERTPHRRASPTQWASLPRRRRRWRATAEPTRRQRS